MRTLTNAVAFAGLLLNCVTSSAADLDFYAQFRTLLTTNDWGARGITNATLLDTNNTSPRLNSVLSVETLRTEGSVGSIRLGMTMQDVVDHWGKPRWFHPQCHGGHMFSFADCALVFGSNHLDKVLLRTATFDHGLSTRSTLEAWQQALGSPTIDKEDSFGRALVYEHVGNPRTVLELTFDSDGNGRWATLYLNPPLTNWFNQKH